MKPRLVCFLMVVLPVLADGQPLQQFSERFECRPECNITWAATNRLPAKVKTFKVVPTAFSPETISNLLQFASLTPKNRKSPVQSGVFMGKDVSAFGNREETRSLEIVPSQGFVVLVNREVIAGARQASEGVPERKNVLKHALEQLHAIGVNQTEIATNTFGKIEPRTLSEETEIFKDKTSGTVVTNVLARWVWLNRQIEGITVSGEGGILFKFGNFGKISELRWTWRKIEPFKELPVPNPDELVKLIKSGKTMVRTGTSQPFMSLTITNASLFYWENSGSEPQKYIYPFAVLNAKTDREGEASSVDIFVTFQK